MESSIVALFVLDDFFESASRVFGTFGAVVELRDPYARKRFAKGGKTLTARI